MAQGIASVLYEEKLAQVNSHSHVDSEYDSSTEENVAVIDSGLACLTLIARFHGIAVDPAPIAHEFQEPGRSFDRDLILLAARKIGLKAKAARSSLARISHLALPAVVIDPAADYLSTVREMGADIAQNAATLHEIDAQIRKLADTLPIEQKKEKDFAGLIVNGDVGLHDYYNEQQTVIQIQQDLSAERAKLAETEAMLNASQRKREAYITQIRRTWLGKIHDDDAKAAGLVQDLTKAQQRGKAYAPIGAREWHGAATQGPYDGRCRDSCAGDHDAGARSRPTHGGSHDRQPGHRFHQEQPDRRGESGNLPIHSLRHAARHRGAGIQRRQAGRHRQEELGVHRPAGAIADTMQIEDREIRLTQGMNVTAEIKTGRRRIIGYLLSPLMQHPRESLYER